MKGDRPQDDLKVHPAGPGIVGHSAQGGSRDVYGSIATRAFRHGPSSVESAYHHMRAAAIHSRDLPGIALERPPAYSANRGYVTPVFQQVLNAHLPRGSRHEGNPGFHAHRVY